MLHGSQARHPGVIPNDPLPAPRSGLPGAAAASGMSPSPGRTDAALTPSLPPGLSQRPPRPPCPPHPAWVQVSQLLHHLLLPPSVGAPTTHVVIIDVNGDLPCRLLLDIQVPCLHRPSGRTFLPVPGHPRGKAQIPAAPSWTGSYQHPVPGFRTCS